MSPRRRALLVTLVAFLAGVACSEVDNVEAYRELAADINAAGGMEVWYLLPDAGEVARVTVEGDGRLVELLATDGGLWQPGRGAAGVTASLMAESEDHLLPLPAYRRLRIDDDPSFGFDDSGPAVTVETRAGERTRVRIGGPNPTGAGSYARRDGDPHTYVVVREAVNDLRSLLAGTRVVPAPDPEIERVLAEDAAVEDPEEVTNPWLGQVLAEASSPSPSSP